MRRAFSEEALETVSTHRDTAMPAESSSVSATSTNITRGPNLASILEKVRSGTHGEKSGKFRMDAFLTDVHSMLL